MRPSTPFIRIAVLVAVWLLGTSTFSIASNDPASEPVPSVPTVPGSEAAAPVAEEEPEAASPLIVPDVRNQPYVFAKGILEDAGFAWKVVGKVDGYPSNIVGEQAPAPGTKLEDTGAPTVSLRLERNRAYDERGIPAQTSPFRGTAVVQWTPPRADDADTPRPAPQTPDPTDTAPVPAVPQPAAPTETGVETAPAATEADPAAGAETVPVEPAAATTAARPAGRKAARKPAFTVKGAPREPLDELRLDQRARLVERRLAAADRPTAKLVRWWLYQHAWVVTGARFGWSHGADALRILIRADEAAQERWGIGAKSERTARAALRFVVRRSS
ncbi:MAG: PASTA domain-containing protein [Thermoleophilia bacterium]